MRLLDKRTYASLDQIQSVWAAVSEEPRITIRQLSQQTGISRTKVNQILHFLEAAHYIEHQYKRSGRHVLVPFVSGTPVYAVELPAKKSIHEKVG